MSHRVVVPAWIVALLLLGAGPLQAAPEDAKPAAKGPHYRNQSAGVSAEAPPGWRMRADAVVPVEWNRMVTFYDPNTDADMVFSRRKKTTSSVRALLRKVQKEWAQSKGMRVLATRAVEATPLVKVPHVIVDGSYVLKPKPKKGAESSVPPPPVPYRVNATYFLGADGEFLLYAKAQETHWSRLQTKLRRVRDSVTFATAPSTDGEGLATYRNDKVGFTCKYPSTHSIHVSKYANQIVGFVPQAADGAKIEVYRLNYDGAPEADARRLVTFYVQDQGGEAERSDTMVAGKEAALVIAKAEIGNGLRSMQIASFKRADGKMWRIKVTAPGGQEAKAAAAFKKFVDNFQLTRAE